MELLTDGDASLTMTRTELLALPEAMVADVATMDEGDSLPALFGHAVVLRTHRHHLVISRLAASEIRQLDIWLGDAGVVAQARQASPDTPSVVIGLSPVDAPRVWGSALEFANVPAAPAPASSTLDGLANAATAAGSTDFVHVVDIESSDGSPTRRLVVQESTDGRRMATDAAAGVDDDLELRPATASAVLCWLSAATAAPMPQS